jgi:predicted CopG family antitoxin
MEKTTIQISVGTLERLRALKRFERESYDDVINFVVDDYGDDELTSEEIDGIQEALEDVRKNGTIPIEEVMKEAGISRG